MMLSNLPKRARGMLDDFVKGLKNIYGDGLVSVILYGCAASGEYSSANSNVNIAVVLDDAGLANIARAKRLVNKRRFGIIRPVFFTEKYIASSTDVFPLEFLDMKENNIVLYGKDVLRDVRVDEKNLRFQCEQELKSKLINIKTVYLDLRSASDRRKLLFKFTSSVLHLLRNALRLKGRVLIYSKEGVAASAAEEFGVGMAAFKKILDARSGKLKLTSKEVDGLFVDIVRDLEKMAEAIDRM